MSAPAAAVRIEHHHARLGEVSLHYATAGDGEPVVLLHGWPSTWYEWRHVMPLLAGRYRVIAPDLRGLGDSSRPAAGYDKKTVAADLWQLLSGTLGPRAAGTSSATTGAGRWRSRSRRRIPKRSAR